MKPKPKLPLPLFTFQHSFLAMPIRAMNSALHQACFKCKIFHVSNLMHTVYIRFGFLCDEGPMLETLDYTTRIGSTPTFLYFDLYLYSACTAHYVYLYNLCLSSDALDSTHNAFDFQTGVTIEKVGSF